jgi:hypothetical protein
MGFLTISIYWRKPLRGIRQEGNSFQMVPNPLRYLLLVAAVVTAALSLSASTPRFVQPRRSVTGPASKQSLARQDGDAVTFDNYSLILNGERVFLQCVFRLLRFQMHVSSSRTTCHSSGEVHTFRLPVPGLWRDILEKTRAAGLNAISLYTHMGLSNPSRGVVDFDDWRNLTTFFELAKELGVYIVLRPGPNINAETSAGGIAHWVTAEVEGKLMSNASDWREAWIPYIQGIVDQTAPYQLTEGGTIIGMHYPPFNNTPFY